MRSCTAALCLALAAACAAPAGKREAVLAPDGVDRVFEYLAAKYDADGDGAIAPAEYRRAGASFEGLDADRDGALTPADFPDEDFVGGMGIGHMDAELRARLRASYDARAV